MAESVMVALITSGLALIGVVIGQLARFRSRDLEAHEHLHTQLGTLEDANRTAHEDVRNGLTRLASDLHEHRVVTENKLDGLSASTQELKEQAAERERYWRDRGETVTERLARLEAQRRSTG